jgi:sulfite exporter TauE/SafE
MKVVRFVSYGLTALGLLLVLLGAIFDLSPALTLTGMFLVIAGVVKIVIVRIWHVMFQIPVPTGDREPVAESAPRHRAK